MFTEELSSTPKSPSVTSVASVRCPPQWYVSCPEAVVSTVSSQMKHADQTDDNEVDRDNEIEQTRDDEN
jgi:hypothetical protein